MVLGGDLVGLERDQGEEFVFSFVGSEGLGQEVVGGKRLRKIRGNECFIGGVERSFREIGRRRGRWFRCSVEVIEDVYGVGCYVLVIWGAQAVCCGFIFRLQKWDFQIGRLQRIRLFLLFLSGVFFVGCILELFGSFSITLMFGFVYCFGVLFGYSIRVILRCSLGW